MREILFRGKCFYNGKWAEGFIVASRENTYPNGFEMITVDGINYDELDSYIPHFTSYAVDPSTICQYTGLKDKNGKKIFEGDIVRLTDKYNEMEWTAVVVFGNPNGDYNWGWQLNAIEEFDGNKDILLWVDMEELGAYCEIIGSIHDNPELIGGKANG